MKIRPAKGRRVYMIGDFNRLPHGVRGTIIRCKIRNKRLYIVVEWDSQHKNSSWYWVEWKNEIEVYDESRR